MFVVHGLTYDEMTDELDRFEQLFHAAVLRVMQETAHHLGQVATAAGEPSQSGEPAASMDTLGLIATLWAAQVLATPDAPEPGLIAALRRVYYQSVNRIRDALQRARHRATAPEPDAVPNVIPSDEISVEFPDLLPDLPDTAENDSLLLPDDIAYDYLSHASNRMVRFSDELWLSAREQLLQGFAEGESIDELRDRLINVANLTEPRAVMVARTEVHQAAEAGSLAMVQYSEFTGTKSWLATEDARTRPTHVLADGQTVGLEDFFDVGGFPLLFPGDPDGPPQETIQCRCTQTYNLDDEPLPLIASEREVNMADTATATEVLVADTSTVAMDDIPALVTSDMEPENSIGWEAVLVVEGVPTGDGRQFADGALTWAELPVSLLWQKMTADGHSGSCIVGKIDSIERQGNQLIGRGTFDTEGEYGAEALRLVQEQFLKGVSVDVDSIDQSNIEYFYPEAQMQDELVAPDLVIFHSGRIRGATLCAIPAFVEAVIRVTSPEEVAPGMEMPEEMPQDGYALTAAAVPSHKTATSDGPWDAAAEQKKLETPMSLAMAKAMYAWYDADKVDGGEIGVTACKFPHHEVGANGTPGAANLKACSAGIAALHGARTPTTIPDADRKGVYDHLARHLKDGGMTPPDFAVEEVVTAAAYVLTIPDVPPAWWFEEPVDVEMHGALTVTDEGRVYGWVAPAGIAHRSFERRVEVPMGNVDYTKFMGREAIVEGGRLVTGALTMDCGHASVSNPDGAVALEHYDNSCSVFANVCIGERPGKGVWVAGSVVPGVTANQIVRAMACQLSGDWRPHKEKSGWREFTGALLVPVPGFAMARAQASVRMDEGQLVASTVPVRYEETDHSCGCSAEVSDMAAEVSDTDSVPTESAVSFNAIAEFIARSIGRTPGARAEELRTLVHGPKE